MTEYKTRDKTLWISSWWCVRINFYIQLLRSTVRLSRTHWFNPRRLLASNAQFDYNCQFTIKFGVCFLNWTLQPAIPIISYIDLCIVFYKMDFMILRHGKLLIHKHQMIKRKYFKRCINRDIILWNRRY